MNYIIFFVRISFFLSVAPFSTLLIAQNLGEITIYNTENSGLSYNQIHSLEFDQEERLWIGTEDGLSIFSPNLDNWTVFTEDTVFSTLKSSIIKSLHYKNENTMFIGTSNGLNNVSWENSITNTYDFWINQSWSYNETEESDTLCDIAEGIVNSILHYDNLWIGTNDGLCVENYGLDNGWLIHNSETSFYSSNITCIKKNINTDLIAIGTVNGGLILYDGDWNIYHSSNSPILDNTIHLFIAY